MLVAKITLMAVLVFTAYQDFKLRAISWMVLPLIFIATIYIKYWETNNLFFLRDTLVNIIVLTVIILFSYFYFVLKSGTKVREFMDGYIGLGDILFFIAITPYFQPITFLAFLLASYFFILLGFIVFYMIKGNKATIPLAGLVSVFFIIVLVVSFFEPHLDFFDYGIGNLYNR